MKLFEDLKVGDILIGNQYGGETKILARVDNVLCLSEYNHFDKVSTLRPLVSIKTAKENFKIKENEEKLQECLMENYLNHLEKSMMAKDFYIVNYCKVGGPVFQTLIRRDTTLEMAFEIVSILLGLGDYHGKKWSIKYNGSGYFKWSDKIIDGGAFTVGSSIR